MRVLQLCLSDGHGGLELYVSRLCALLPARNIDCTAVARPGTLLARQLADQGTRVMECRPLVRKMPIMAARWLAGLMHREQIDILHVHWAKDLPLAALAKSLCRRPIRLIHSRHMSITRPKHDPYHRFLYKSVDKLVVLSELMRDEARRYLPMADAALVKILHGVAAPAAIAQAEPERERPLRIGLFGRIQHYKGQHLLIEAVDTLRARGVGAHANIIGHSMDDEYLASLQQDVSQRGLQAQVSFAGFHPSPQSIMPDFDVIVLTTDREPFGLVLIEAMRSGVAVIGSNAGGVLEIIEHGKSGLLFESGSAESLAEQLQRLAENPIERYQLAAAGRRRADELFSEERHLSDIEHLLKSVLMESPEQV
jgi:glycosyltransferase involved in cell wall biosynthesis